MSSSRLGRSLCVCVCVSGCFRGVFPYALSGYALWTLSRKRADGTPLIFISLFFIYLQRPETLRLGKEIFIPVPVGGHLLLNSVTPNAGQDKAGRSDG